MKKENLPDCVKVVSTDLTATSPVILTVDSVSEALIKSNGYIAASAKLLKVHTSALRRYIESNPKIKAVQDDINEERLDVVEEALMDRVNRGDFAAISLYLKCHGKSRGWVESAVHISAKVPVNESWADFVKKSMGSK